MIADNETYTKWLQTESDRPDVNDEKTRKTLEMMGMTMIHELTIENTSVNLGFKNLNGFSFKLHQPWYKAMPIGMIHDMSIRLNDRIVDRERIFLIMKGGQRIMMVNARTIQDIWWNIMDPITVFIAKNEKMPKGDHTLEVILAQQIPEYYQLPMNALVAKIQCTMTVN